MANGGGKTVWDFPCVILVGIGRGAEGESAEGLGHLGGLFTCVMGIFGVRQKGSGDTERLGGGGDVIRIGTGGGKGGEGPHIGGRTGGGRVGKPGGGGGRRTGGGGTGNTGGAGEEQVPGPMG